MAYFSSKLMSITPENLSVVMTRLKLYFQVYYSLMKQYTEKLFYRNHLLVEIHFPDKTGLRQV